MCAARTRASSRRRKEARCGCVAGCDVDVELGCEVAELGEPEPVFVDEVERESVAPWRDRAADLHFALDPFARFRAHGVADAVPHDRVAAIVEPVVRDVQVAPGCRPGVLDDDLRMRERARLHGRELVREPAHRERAGRNGVLARHATSLRPVDPLLVRACRREPVERTPVWFMRQAGRSLPEYRELRKQHGLFDIVAQPELCAEVTLQPVRRHDVDAAVMFTDIMFPVLGMGVDVELVENVGPVIERPIRTAADVERLVVPDPNESVPAILEAVRLVRAELRDDQAVIGFCGGLEKLAGTSALYVAAKARAGADVIQVFDSWVGALSPSDYEEFVAPYSARILDAVDVPTIHFGTGTATLLQDMSAAGGDVIGLDWRIPLDRGWAEVGDERGVQGNLDPALLLGPWERIEAETRAILGRAGGRPGHVFNLGHGVPPETDPAVLRRLTEFVHEATVEARV